MKIHILSLGCARALVDSEGLGGLLQASGHAFTKKVEEAECVVVNTCAFMQSAEEESISTVLDLAERKRSGKLRSLYVVGCLPQKRKNEQGDLLKLLPEVDGFLGTADLTKLPELLKEQDPPQRDPFFVASPVPTLLFESQAPRFRLTPKHYAFLKISEGCDHACSFCSIPQYRGPHRSRSIEDLVAGAQQLAAQGVVELNLIGQDSSAYGEDLYGELKFPELLRELNQVEGIKWIRILYAHPSHVTDELIGAIRDLPKVVNYIDIPLQHIAAPMLKAMRRETDGNWIRKMVERFRREIPEVVLRSTFIVGFPGETEAQVDELADFLKAARLERVGMFPYAVEPKTSAEKMPDQISEEIKQARLDRLMSLQREISQEIQSQWIGRTLSVLVDEPGNEPGVVLGRSYADAPEVDGQVFVKSASLIPVGQFVDVKVMDATEYDLVAEPIPAPEKRAAV